MVKGLLLRNIRWFTLKEVFLRDGSLSIGVGIWRAGTGAFIQRLGLSLTCMGHAVYEVYAIAETVSADERILTPPLSSEQTGQPPTRTRTAAV